MTEYVTTADALFFHQEMIRRYGRAAGVRDAGALESALLRPKTGYYDTIVEEAAALLESLVQIHPFIGGNQCVALAVVDVFLRINGYAVAGDSSRLSESLIELLENQRFAMEFLVPWLEVNIVNNSAC
jgi:death-on-curing protein